MGSLSLDLFAPAPTATFSPCRRYRYTLTRSIGAGTRRALFVMLNPSTADEAQDDPTIRRCIAFARREGCGSLEVANLFAWRATDPVELRTAPDPVGPDNDRHIVEAAGRASLIVCAWGVHGCLLGRERAVRQLLAGRALHALGFTKEGAPRHPLYVKSDAPLWPMPFGVA